LDGYLLNKNNPLNTIFTRFLTGQTIHHTLFDPHLCIVTLYELFLHNFFSIITYQSSTFSHSIISLSLLLFSSAMCFCHWPFIQKGYYNFLGIVWKSKVMVPHCKFVPSALVFGLFVCVSDWSSKFLFPRKETSLTSVSFPPSSSTTSLALGI